MFAGGRFVATETAERLLLCAAVIASAAVEQAKSQFKSRSIANNVEIIIPVPNDVDSPTFKASIGSVAYLPDQVSPKSRVGLIHHTQPKFM